MPNGKPPANRLERSKERKERKMKESWRAPEEKKMTLADERRLKALKKRAEAEEYRLHQLQQIEILHELARVMPADLRRFIAHLCYTDIWRTRMYIKVNLPFKAAVKQDDLDYMESHVARSRRRPNNLIPVNMYGRPVMNLICVYMRALQQRAFREKFGAHLKNFIDFSKLISRRV